MAYLGMHSSVSHVVGVDGIRMALEEFVKEHPELKIQEGKTEDGYERFSGGKNTLLKGDFFELNADHVQGQVDAVWDRASLVAISPSLREAYVQVIKKLLKPGGTILLSVLERRSGTEEGMKNGPPFSVAEQEVRRLYETQEDWIESVTLLEEVDEFARNPQAKTRIEGVTGFYELVFEIKAKA